MMAAPKPETTPAGTPVVISCPECFALVHSMNARHHADHHTALEEIVVQLNKNDQVLGDALAQAMRNVATAIRRSR